MDKNARGIMLSMQHLEMPNMTLGVPMRPGQNSEENDQSDSEDEDLPKGHKPDAYSTKELCRTLIGTPTWDGKPLTWKAFMKEWKAYWEFQKGLVGPKAKKWIFIKSLPEKWQIHMKANITDADWNYKSIVEFLNHQNNIMVPDWKKESQWRQCIPRGNSYMDFIHWWMTWRRLGGECDLRNQDWNHQFNACMNHNNYFSTYLQEIIENEVIENVTWDIERRYTFIANKLMIAFKAHETLKAGNSQESPSRTLVCYKCGRKGHTKSQCWSTSTRPNSTWNGNSGQQRYSASSRAQEPKSSSTCYSCGQPGHFSAECPKKAQAPAAAQGSKGANPSSGHGKAGGGFSRPWNKGKGKSTSTTPWSGSGGRGKGFSQPTAHAGLGPQVAYPAAKSRAVHRDELERRRSQGLCAYCGKPGHFSDKCPLKDMQADRKYHEGQRHVAAKGSKGKGAKGSKGSKGKGKGKPSGKAKGSNSLRELDAHEQGDPDHEYFDENFIDEDYDAWWEDEEHASEWPYPQEGEPTPTDV